MGSYGIWMALSSLLSAIMGGGTIYLFTLKSQKAKAKAEANVVEANADGAELKNVENAIKIWREMAECLKKELEDQKAKSEDMGKQLESLRKEINRLTRINSRIVELLNNMTSDNFEKMVERIKNEITN